MQMHQNQEAELKVMDDSPGLLAVNEEVFWEMLQSSIFLWKN